MSQRELNPLTRDELRLLFMLALVQFTHIMDFMIMMPLGPQLMRIFEITPRQFGFLVSAYTYVAGLGGFFGAFFIDRFDRKSALIVSYTGFAIGTLACAIAPTYLFLMAARSFAGAFGGVLGALIFSVVADALENNKRGRAMGIVSASFSMSSVFGVPFGIYLASLFSWHAPFVFVGIVAIVNILMLVVWMPKMRAHVASREDRPSPKKVLSNIVSDPHQLLALSFTVILMFSQFLVIPFLSPAMVANVGFSEAELAYIYLIGGGLTIFTSPLVGRLADKYGRVTVFTFASTLVVIPNLIVTHLGPTPIWMVLIVTAAFFVLSNGRFVPSMAMITSVVSPKSRGSFMSINSCVQSLASGSAAMVSGLIIESGTEGTLLNYNYVGYLSVFMALIAVWLGRTLGGRKVREN